VRGVVVQLRRRAEVPAGAWNVQAAVLVVPSGFLTMGFSPFFFEENCNDRNLGNHGMDSGRSKNIYAYIGQRKSFSVIRRPRYFHCPLIKKMRAVFESGLHESPTRMHSMLGYAKVMGLTHGPRPSNQLVAV
jgi:hypothetical protein